MVSLTSPLQFLGVVDGAAAEVLLLLSLISFSIAHVDIIDIIIGGLSFVTLWSFNFKPFDANDAVIHLVIISVNLVSFLSFACVHEVWGTVTLGGNLGS